MSIIYELYLSGIEGGDETEIIQSLKGYMKITEDEVRSRLTSLPLLIFKTENKAGAFFVKSTLNKLGAKIQVKTFETPGSSLDSSVHRDQNTNNLKNIDGHVERNNVDIRKAIKISNYPVTHRPNKSPVSKSTGCLVVVLAGLLLIVSGLVLFLSISF
jgi:hypothetical protein